MAYNHQRQVLVDDNDPRVVYGNPNQWDFDQTGINNRLGNYGEAFNSTLHGVSSDASFTFEFSGTSIDVFGFTDVAFNEDGTDPSWECFVDQGENVATKPFQFAENNWQLCTTDLLEVGNHTLTVNVKVKLHTFWLDYIMYTPSEIPTPDARLIYVPDTDLSFRYDADWRPLGEFWWMTTVHGSQVSFNFTGTKVWWYGMYPREMPHKSTIASYSIDGGSEQSFTLHGSASNTTEYNQRLFETTNLVQGEHILVVTFQGDSKTTPLTIDYLIVEGEPSMSSNTSPPTTTQKTIQSDGPNKASHLNTTAIVCGTIFPILFIALLFGAFWMSRKRRRIRPARPSRTFTLASPPPSPLPRRSPITWLPHPKPSLTSPISWWRRFRNVNTGARIDDVRSQESSWKPDSFGSPPHYNHHFYQDLPHTPSFSPWTRSPSPPEFPPVVARLSFGEPGPSREDNLRRSVVVSPRTDNNDYGNQSYYGGYQTKREIMEQEASARRSILKS